MLGKEGFDRMAESYDNMTEVQGKRSTYPFAGYETVRDRVVELVLSKERPSVLDLGFGTGKITSRLYEKGCRIYGQDFSEKMVLAAQEKMPEAKLYLGDFAEGIREELKKETYDFIIATYSLHHLEDEGKEKLLKEAFSLLSEGGKIIIGDIAFLTEEEMKICREKAGEEWDEEEIYFVKERFPKLCEKMEFEKISNCSAVIVME